MITAEQIKDVKFYETKQTGDSNDPRYDGELVLTLTDGTRKEIRLTSVHEGHCYDFNDRDRQHRIQSVVDYQELYDHDFNEE
jgi:hypothetical protein